ncbi:ABC transporter permease [Trueperella bialowiezensis]|uniref:2-aminoethylphosphonate transport system permease PhnU n=1 Tax=Trueperella bialowiezensis TaxID=312285 RepID=A0A3S4VSN5_9ACTO|nr:ABC transporter permease subunit [Trueperella bialowiezensis]VEI12854.1 2-aminoethylphosphonate transport system permease PhnU [Trueperella bialowiezensis]
MAEQLVTTPASAKRPAGKARGLAASGDYNWASLAILAVSLCGLLLPWIAAATYGFSRPGQPFTFDPLIEVFGQGRASEALVNTLLLTAATTILMLVLLVPTIVFLNIKAPRLAKLAEVLSILPMVVPAVALVSGVSELYRTLVPGFITSLWSLVPLYVVIVMPLCYRAIDAGVKSLDLRTIFAASSSLGANTLTTLREAVIPNLRVAMLSAALLCISGVLGEFAMASLLGHYTFPVYMVEVSSNSPKGVAALSFIVTIITWLLLVAISALANQTKRRQQK